MATAEVEFPIDLTKGTHTKVKYEDGILSSEVRGEVGGEPYYDTKGVYESEVMDIGDKFASFGDLVLERYKEEPAQFSPELSNGTISNEGKTITLPVTNSHGVVSKAKDSGKWYWEVKYESGTSHLMAGIIKDGAGTAWTLTTSKYYYAVNGSKYSSNTSSTYGAAYAPGDVISVMLDLDVGTIEFWKNGVSQGVAYTDIKALGLVRPSFVSASVSMTITLRTAQKDFQYVPPEGFSPYAGKEDTTVVRQFTRSSPDGTAWEEYREVIGGAIQSTPNQYFQVKLELYPTMSIESNVELDFESANESEKFSNTEFLDFVGGLRLKGNHTYEMLPQTWGEEGALHRKKVIRSPFKRIDSLRILR